MVIDVVYIHVMFITCNSDQQAIKLFFLYCLVILVMSAVSQRLDQSLTSRCQSKVTHTSSLNSQTEIRPIISTMSSIKYRTH